MAYLGINNDPCPKCGSTITIEIQNPLHTEDMRREVLLKCLDCKKTTSYGIYKLVGNALVKVK